MCSYIESSSCWHASLKGLQHRCGGGEGKGGQAASCCYYSAVLVEAAAAVMAQLACMPENHGDMHADPMMGSGGLPEGRLGEVGPRMETGEPLEGRSSINDEVSMSHGCSGQDLDYLACWPVLAQSMQCRRRVPAWKAAQWSLDAPVSMTIVQ